MYFAMQEEDEILKTIKPAAMRPQPSERSAQL
jgi:hypothetical protein